LIPTESSRSISCEQKIPAGQLFDVMSHDRAARRTIRPEPDKRDGLDRLCLHAQDEQPLEALLYGSIDRPAREANVFPVAQVCPLNVSPDGNWQERAHPVVEAPCHRLATKPGSVSTSVVSVPFVPEVVDDFAGIERKSNAASAGCDIGQGIVERASGLLAPGSRRRAPITNRLEAKAEISRIVAELSGKLENLRRSRDSDSGRQSPGLLPSLHTATSILVLSASAERRVQCLFGWNLATTVLALKSPAARLLCALRPCASKIVRGEYEQHHPEVTTVVALPRSGWRLLFAHTVRGEA